MPLLGRALARDLCLFKSFLKDCESPVYPVEASPWSGTPTAAVFSYQVFTFQSPANVSGSLEVFGGINHSAFPTLVSFYG